MPIYSYECPECGAVTDVERSYKDRMDPQPCDECHMGWAEYVMVRGVAPHYTGERKVREGRLIRDERELGPRWRDEGTTGREGGAGKMLTFDQGRK